jgi:hypothetical protein
MEHEKKSFEDLVADCKDFVVSELLDARPFLAESGEIDKLQAIVEEVYPASWNSRLSGNNVDVLLVPIGVGEPVNYIGAYIAAANKKLDEAKERMNAGNNDLWNKYLAEGWFDTNGVPLDRRAGKRGRYKVNTSFFCNVLAWGTDITGNHDFILQDTLGGEKDDKAVNTICSKCGKQSITRKCPYCGNDRGLYELEDIARACFKRIKSTISIKTQKVGNQEVPIIKWGKRTSVPSERVPITKQDFEKFLTIPLVQERNVKYDDLERLYKTHFNVKKQKPDRSFWVLFIGTVNSPPDEPDGRGRYKMVVFQKGQNFIDAKGKAVGGTNVMIPEHVYAFMGGDQISKYSKIAVIGNIDIREQWTKQTGTIKGQFNPPEINAWSFFIIDNARPKGIKEDVTEGPVALPESAYDEMDTSGTFFGDVGAFAASASPAAIASVPTSEIEYPVALPAEEPAVVEASDPPGDGDAQSSPPSPKKKTKAKTRENAETVEAQLPEPSSGNQDSLDFF